jgi:general stress protein 26
LTEKSQILAFMRAHRLAVQATASTDGAPQAAVVGFAVSDRFEIVFDTLASTRKAQNIRANSRVAFVIGGLKRNDERTVQYEGVADEPVGAELERLKSIYYKVFPDGPDRLNWPGLIYLCVRPTWIRYSDYTRDPAEIVELGVEELL